MANPEYAKYACKHAGTTVRFFFLGGGPGAPRYPANPEYACTRTKYACKLNRLTVY